METRQIVQLIPASGWSAAFVSDVPDAAGDGYTLVPLIAFALVQDEDSDEIDVQRFTSVVGLCDFDPIEVAEEDCDFIGYQLAGADDATIRQRAADELKRRARTRYARGGAPC